MYSNALHRHCQMQYSGYFYTIHTARRRHPRWQQLLGISVLRVRLPRSEEQAAEEAVYYLEGEQNARIDHARTAPQPLHRGPVWKAPLAAVMLRGKVSRGGDRKSMVYEGVFQPTERPSLWIEGEAVPDRGVADDRRRRVLFRAQQTHKLTIEVPFAKRGRLRSSQVRSGQVSVTEGLNVQNPLHVAVADVDRHETRVAVNEGELAQHLQDAHGLWSYRRRYLEREEDCSTGWSRRGVAAPTAS